MGERTHARVLAIALALLGCGADADAVRTVTVERGSLSVAIEVEGTIRAVESSVITPPGVPGLWDYKIAMMAPEGATVADGAPILGFDATELQARFEAKTSERDSAAKQLELELAAAKMTREDEKLAAADADAQLRKARQKAEAPAEITALIELDKARLDLALAQEKRAHLERKAAAARRGDEAELSRLRSKRSRAEARIGEIGAAIEQMTVEAPRAGTVIYATNWSGEKKKVGDSAWRAETILQVASLAEMEARGEVDEVDAELRGTVREISHTVRRSSPDNPLKTLGIDIALEPTDDVALRPGMRFRGFVEIDRARDVLLVPLEAVDTTPSGPVVWRRSVAGLESVSVTLGRRDATHVEVLDGVGEGDVVEYPRRTRDAEAP
jgi:multidrug efflux pump subunit AcrA (membrane-fusion protein)